MRNIKWMLVLLVLAGACYGHYGDYNDDGCVDFQDYAMAANGGWNLRVWTVIENWLECE